MQRSNDRTSRRVVEERQDLPRRREAARRCPRRTGPARPAAGGRAILPRDAEPPRLHVLEHELGDRERRVQEARSSAIPPASARRPARTRPRPRLTRCSSKIQPGPVAKAPDSRPWTSISSSIQVRPPDSRVTRRCAESDPPRQRHREVRLLGERSALMALPRRRRERAVEEVRHPELRRPSREVLAVERRPPPP